MRAFVAVATLSMGCGGAPTATAPTALFARQQPAAAPSPGEPWVFSLLAETFVPEGPIPERHTCDGTNLSPALRWYDLPSGTRSLTMTLLDLDADQQIHWLVYRVSPDSSLLEGASPHSLPIDSREGTNDFGNSRYDGPCPPDGETHRYAFVLDALDVVPPDYGTADARQIQASLAANVLGRAILYASYRRAR